MITDVHHPQSGCNGMPALTELRDGNARETAQSILDIGSNHDRVRPEEVQEGADRVRDGGALALPLSHSRRGQTARGPAQPTGSVCPRSCRSQAFKLTGDAKRAHVICLNTMHGWLLVDVLSATPRTLLSRQGPNDNTVQDTYHD